jgi:hypothetical protein
MVWTNEQRRIHAALHRDAQLRRRARLRMWFWAAAACGLMFVAVKTKAQEVSLKAFPGASAAVVNMRGVAE